MLGKMRTTGRGSRPMTDEELEKFLSKEPYGTISYTNEEHWPDSRVVNVGYYNNCFYLHVSKTGGDKLMAWKSGMRVCLSMVHVSDRIGQDFICSHDSALIYGTLIRVEDTEENLEEMIHGIHQLCVQGAMLFKGEQAYLNKCIHAIGVWKIIPEYKIGKKVHFSSLPAQHTNTEK